MKFEKGDWIEINSPNVSNETAILYKGKIGRVVEMTAIDTVVVSGIGESIRWKKRGAAFNPTSIKHIPDDHILNRISYYERILNYDKG